MLCQDLQQQCQPLRKKSSMQWNRALALGVWKKARAVGLFIRLCSSLSVMKCYSKKYISWSFYVMGGHVMMSGVRSCTRMCIRDQATHACKCKNLRSGYTAWRVQQLFAPSPHLSHAVPTNSSIQLLVFDSLQVAKLRFIDRYSVMSQAGQLGESNPHLSPDIGRSHVSVPPKHSMVVSCSHMT